jgi:aryl-alcohol dehydrogenase-like predicted oxidoreductase
MKRKLGRSGIEVSALGFGCWAIGGEMWMDQKADGWGAVDDAESIRALRRALELGVTFLDTSDAYGCGHSEEVIGEAIAGHRDEVVLCTKFGHVPSEGSRTLAGTCVDPGYIERACRASLRRLGTDRIDLYLLHVWSVQVAELGAIREALERLVQKGMIRSYGWSTDLVDGARLIAQGRHATAVEHNLNLFSDAPELVALCEREGLASVNRGPLAMGFLTGKFGKESRLPMDDVRGAGHAWVPYFQDGRPVPALLEKLAAVREVLQSGGRTLAQGALGWLWARSPATLPIPGFKSVKQVEENAGALRHGPLSPGQMEEIARLLASPA